MGNMKKYWKTIIKNCDMLNAIRIRKNTASNVEALKEDLGISRASADHMYNSLAGKGETGSVPIIVRSRESGRLVNIVSNLGYFLGISVGAAHIRVVLLGLDLEPIPRKRIESYDRLKGIEAAGDYLYEESDEVCYAFKTPKDADKPFEAIRELVSRLLSMFLEQAEESDGLQVQDAQFFPLMGIGFGVTGPVDYKEKLWCSSSRFGYIGNISLQDLIGYENQERIEALELFVSLDNDAKAAIVSEYQYLLEKSGGVYANDTFLIYIGSGIGSSAVIGGKLLRGSHNASGELGQIPLFFTGADGDLSNAETIEQCLTRNMEDKELREQNYKKYLPYILNMANCILGVDRFVLVGHNVKNYRELIPALMNQRMKFTVYSTQRYCTAENGRGRACTAAIGAAIEAYYCMCRYDLDSGSSDRMNLATDISWRTIKQPG